METVTHKKIESIVGELVIVISNHESLAGVLWSSALGNRNIGLPEPNDNPFIAIVEGQINEYLRGKRHHFDLPTSRALVTKSTEFQRLVWDALSSIPYGETRTYKQLAEMIGRPKACRAVGSALHLNPLCIVVPCHRIVPTNSKANCRGGFAGGREAKERLLGMESMSMANKKQTGSW